MRALIIGTLLLTLGTGQALAHDCQSYLDLLCPDSKELTECDKKLIYAYTRGLYTPLNEHLRGMEVDPKCDAIQEDLLAALKKLKPTGAKTLYRGVRKFEALKNLKVGECFVDPGFVSTSLVKKAALSFVKFEVEAVLFKISAASGRKVSTFSDYPEESEILLMPKTSLKLKARERLTDRVDEYQLVEVNPSDCSN